MKNIITFLSLTFLCGCTTELSDYEKHLEQVSLEYMNRPDYEERRLNQVLPSDYPIEDQLLLIAHGFDANVRGILAGQLSDRMERDKDLYDLVISYLDSDNPAHAWSVAWISEKCLNNGPDYEPTWERKDVRDFENKYHK